jgi:hypothetical protein
VQATERIGFMLESRWGPSEMAARSAPADMQGDRVPNRSPVGPPKRRENSYVLFEPCNANWPTPARSRSIGSIAASGGANSGLCKGIKCRSSDRAGHPRRRDRRRSHRLVAPGGLLRPTAGVLLSAAGLLSAIDAVLRDATLLQPDLVRIWTLQLSIGLGSDPVDPRQLGCQHLRRDRLKSTRDGGTRWKQPRLRRK